MAKALLALILAALVLLSAPTVEAAQPSKKPPSWSELASEQQEILAPLSGTWDDLNNARRRKWLAIAKRYPAMKPEEQSRAKRRMEAWASLSPEQRQEARKGFQSIEKLPAEKKQSLRESWEKYQQLPEEKRRELAAEAKKSSGKVSAANKSSPSTPSAGAQPATSTIPPGASASSSAGGEASSSSGNPR